MQETGLILLFDGEAGSSRSENRHACPAGSGHDERSQADILTSGLNLAPAFPADFAASGPGSLYPVTVAQPSPILTGFPDACLRCRTHPHPALFSKNQNVVGSSPANAK